MLDEEYKEVYCNFSDDIPFRSVIVRTGGSHGTLQDVKLPDYAGGFSFSVQGVRRRLFWRVQRDTVELVEEATQIQLTESRLRLQLVQSAVLPGLRVCEDGDCLVLLMATTVSVHCLRLHLTGSVMPSGVCTSVLSQVTAALVTQAENIHLLPPSGTSTAHSAACCLLPDSTAVFVLAGCGPSAPGSIVHVHGGQAVMQPLLTGSLMGRLMGLVAGSSSSATTTNKLHSVQLLCTGASSAVVVALCGDTHVRVWYAGRGDSQPAGRQLLDFDLLRCAGVTETVDRNGHQMAPLHQHRLQLLDGPAGDCSSGSWLAVYLAASSLSGLFLLCRLEGDAGGYRLQHVQTVAAPDHDLLDFRICSDSIWALWTTPEGVCRLSVYHLHDSEMSWRLVDRPIPAPSTVHVSSDEHPALAYLQAIIQPNRFSTQTIRRALAVFSGNQASGVDSSDVDLDTLTADIQSAVDQKCRQMSPESCLSDVERLRLTTRYWLLLYSSCVQYHQVWCKPVGLAVDEEECQVNIVCQSTICYIRPADRLESVWQRAGASQPDLDLNWSRQSQQEQLQQQDEEQPLTDEVLCLASSCSQLEKLSPAGPLIYSCDRHQPLQLAALAAERFLHQPSAHTVMTLLRRLMTQCGMRLCGAIENLLSLFEVEGLSEEEVTSLSGADDINTGDSCLGHTLLAVSVHQTLDLRHRLLQLLLLLLQLLVSRENLLSSEQLLQLKERLLPRAEWLWRCYNSIAWLGWRLTRQPAQQVVSATDQQMALLQPSTALHLATSANCRHSLLHSLVDGCLGEYARSIQPVSVSQHGAQAMLLQTATVLRVVWPSGGSAAPTLLAEALWAGGQLGALNELERRLRHWFPDGAGGRLLLRALALLAVGRHESACQLLMSVASTISAGIREPTVTRLLRLTVSSSHSSDPDHMLAEFYLRALRVLEIHRYSSSVLVLAERAVQICGTEESLGCTLCSILFKYQLELGHVSAAFCTLQCRPLADSRPHKVRQLLAHLLERQQLRWLLQLPLSAGPLLEQVEATLWDMARARHVQCYWLLFALHVRVCDYRRAGRVMYELARRLVADSSAVGYDADPNLLLQRHQCLSAAANALQLVKPDNAWTVTAGNDDGNDDDDDYNQGRSEQAGRNKLCVVTLEEIRVEVACVWARHLLLSRHSVSTGDSVTPSELVALLSARGHWLLACRLSAQAQVSPEPAVRELCTELVAGQAADERVWQLLADNRIADGGDGGSARQQLWNLLRHILDQPGQQQLLMLRAAVARILQLGQQLPDWLSARLERRDPSALCRLLLRAGRLEAASWLLVRLLETSGRQLQQKPGVAVCFPYSQLDQVLDELGSCTEQSDRLKSLYSCLTERLATYTTILQSASRQQMAISDSNSSR